MRTMESELSPDRRKKLYDYFKSELAQYETFSAKVFAIIGQGWYNVCKSSAQKEITSQTD